MITTSRSTNCLGHAILMLCLPCALGLTPGMVSADTIAKIEIMSVSPRDVAQDAEDQFDEVSSGLNVVGLVEKVYLDAEALHGFSISGANWELTGRPTGSNASLGAGDDTMVTLVPDAAGLYLVQLTPLDPLGAPTDPIVQRIYAGVWVGAGVFNTHEMPDSSIPSCANTCCHSESDQERLNVVDNWIGTTHANKLQLHLQGMRGSEYEESCLACHTVGFKETATNGGFDDIATEISYDLQQLVDLIHQAGETGVDNWPQLPAELQRHASIQCESCHGPGSQHLGAILEDDKGIAGVDLSTKQCSQCHDTDLVFGERFYQWNTSSHPVTADLSDGHVADNNTCRVCHTGEGFVYGKIDGGAIPQLATEEYHGITCSACHDPHGSEFPHQLRTADSATIPAGITIQEAGTGAICMNCHNSRVANAETTSLSSSRGAHYGPQTDMWTGVGMAAFELPVVGNSAHTTIVEGTCSSCHMADSENPAVGGHTYAMRVSTDDGDIINAQGACASCHPESTSSYDRLARGDYDGDDVLEGIQSEVKGLIDILRPRLLALPGTSLASGGYINVTTAGFNAMTPNQKRTLYNYNFVVKDGSYGVHNTSFAVQALQRSYFGVTNRPITDDYPNMELRGPVQASTIVPPTPTPTPIPTATPVPTPVPQYLATIESVGVSPRDVAVDETGELDVTASGLRAVGIGEKVFLEAVKIDETVTAYEWSVLQRPSGSTAQLSSATGESVTFQPDKRGTFLIRLTPITAARQVIDVFDYRLYAGEWAGVGTFVEGTSPIAPQCGTGFCHGGNNGDPDLNVLDQWLDSNHANVLQSHMNGERGADYNLGWLEYHTVGFNQDPLANNMGFDDVATQLGFDIATIPALIQDAVENGNDNFMVLPGALRNRASVQCESCHGAGSQHPPNLTAFDKGIDGANLGTKQCQQCHDSTPEFMQGFHQWSNSSHPVTADASEGHVAESDTCRTCHTGEGFIAVRVDKEPIPQMPTEEYHSITCSTCHDPHYSDEPHQLRVAGDFVIPAGAQLFGSGTGGICVRCHNSRIANPESTALTSSRGAHYGTQGDMLIGSGGVAFGLPFVSENTHGIVVPDSCAHCHMADGVGEPGEINPPLVGLHTFAMRDPENNAINADNACATCHSGLDTYDRTAGGDYDGNGLVQGVQTEVGGLLTIMRSGILSTMPGTSAAAGGYINITSGGFNALTQQQKQALYNYNFVAKDGSRGVHNTSYAVQLLQRSYYGVFGKPITQDYPNIDLRGPVQDIPESSSVIFIN